MSGRIACRVILSVVAVLFSSTLSAASPVEVIGDFKVTGAGSGVLFPDGTKQTSAGLQYVRTVIVSPVEGGTIQQNGTALRSALDGITDASINKRYLLKIEPGIYDVGDTGVAMKEYVDIEGSGQHVTVVTGTPSDTVVTNPPGCTLTGANNAEVRFLTVKNTGAIASGRVAAICNLSSSPNLSHITAVCSGGTALCVGIYNVASSAALTNVYADSSGASSNPAIANYNSPSPGPGPTLVNVRASAKVTGGGYAMGILNSGGGADATVVLSNVTAEVSGGTAYTLAIYNITVSAVLHNVTAHSISGNNSFAILTDGFDVCNTCTVRIHNSVLKGAAGAIGEIHKDAGGHGLLIRVANSQLDGAIDLVTPARVKCAGVFDESYVFWPSSCPP